VADTRKAIGRDVPPSNWLTQLRLQSGPQRHMLSLGHRAWRLFPPDTRRWALFSAMAAIAPRLTMPAPSPLGPITVAGYFRAPSGLGEGARRLARIIHQV